MGGKDKETEHMENSLHYITADHERSRAASAVLCQGTVMK